MKPPRPSTLTDSRETKLRRQRPGAAWAAGWAPLRSFLPPPLPACHGPAAGAASASCAAGRGVVRTQQQEAVCLLVLALLLLERPVDALADFARLFLRLALLGALLLPGPLQRQGLGLGLRRQLRPRGVLLLLLLRGSRPVPPAVLQDQQRPVRLPQARHPAGAFRLPAAAAAAAASARASSSSSSGAGCRLRRASQGLGAGRGLLLRLRGGGGGGAGDGAASCRRR